MVTRLSPLATVATATALPGGTLELTSKFVFERNTVEFQRAEGDVIEQLDTVFYPADALVQRFVLFGLARELFVALAQALQFVAQFGKS